ncbi:MAG: low molecular weight protein-tyrosine-phosphatase [Bacteroidota bacterium]|nr:low molecular weight protein-tyrosine-phosphatase [Bacteroidota bacterium]
MKKMRILFVCLGNICRSPSAEAVFRAYVEKQNSSGDFVIDSAGTSAYHAGEPADQRMQKHAKKRGYHLSSISRQFDPESDFDNFDLIVAMDDNNFYDLNKMARDPEDEKKIVRMTDFSKGYDYDYVPDPYFGGSEGFEIVLDLLEDASEGLYHEIKS